MLRTRSKNFGLHIQLICGNRYRDCTHRITRTYTALKPWTNRGVSTSQAEAKHLFSSVLKLSVPHRSDDNLTDIHSGLAPFLVPLLFSLIILICPILFKTFGCVNRWQIRNHEHFALVPSKLTKIILVSLPFMDCLLWTCKMIDRQRGSALKACWLYSNKKRECIFFSAWLMLCTDSSAVRDGHDIIGQLFQLNLFQWVGFAI